MNIAIIGTGLMGSAIADAVQAAGHRLVIFDRDASRAAPLAARGAQVAESVADALRRSERAILVLPDAACVEEALFANDETRAALGGARILNASTTNALEIVALAQRVAEAGGTLAEMSIMVGPDQVRSKESFFLLGASDEDAPGWEETILSFGGGVKRVGVVGDASKAEAPIVFASVLGLLTTAYSAAVALKLKLPPELTSTYPSFLPPGMEHVFSKMLARDHANTFASVRSLIGVARAAEGTAKALGLPSTVFAEIGDLFARTAAHGFGEQDGSSVVEVLLENGDAN